MDVPSSSIYVFVFFVFFSLSFSFIFLRSSCNENDESHASDGTSFQLFIVFSFNRLMFVVIVVSCGKLLGVCHVFDVFIMSLQ